MNVFGHENQPWTILKKSDTIVNCISAVEQAKRIGQQKMLKHPF
jgi:hypothetical protein